MASDFQINGVTHDYASLEVQLGPLAYEPRLTEVSYKETLSRAKVFGTRRKAVGRTGGFLDSEASITLLKSGWDDLIEKLGDGFGLVEFDILIVYRRRGSALYTRDVLERCTIMEPDVSPSQGDDPLATKISLSVMRVCWNGKYMVDDEVG